MLQRITAMLLVAHLALVPASALASQNQLSSPTTGTVSGLQLTNNYNNALDSLNTCNAGASAPTNQLSGAPSAGNCWLNNTGSPYPMSWYDGANWVTPFWVDAANHVTNVKIGGGVATVASAATVDLCALTNAPQAYITITGNTTISSFGSTCKAGHVKFVTFAGTLTVTYNPGSLIIPGAQNVTTSTGDQAVLMALGSGNWQVAFYQPASGAALVNPAVDLGSYLFTSAVTPPSAKYLFAYGQPISRTTYASLMAVQTITQSVTRTNGSSTLTGFSDTTQIGYGACVEGAGIQNSGACTTFIISCTSTTCTMNNNALSPGTSNVTVFPNGNGDGATTFNLPNCQGMTLVGRDNMSGTPRGVLTSTFFNARYAGADALGATGGSQQNALVASQIPQLSFTPSGNISAPKVSVFIGSAAGGTTGVVSYFGTAASGAYQDLCGGGGLPCAQLQSTPAFTGNPITIGSASPSSFATIQPTMTANCMIRVLVKFEIAPGAKTGLVANDDASAAIGTVGRRRLTA